METSAETPTQSPPVVLRRRASRRFVAGVAGGFADYYRTRPIWFRLLFGGSALYAFGVAVSDADFKAFGFGAIVALGAFAGTAAYFLLWWLVPRQDLPESAAERLSRRYPSARRWPGLILLGFGLVILLDRLGVWRGDVVLAAALISAGVLLYRRDGVTLGEVDAPPPAPAGSQMAGSRTSMDPTAGFDRTVARVLPPRERSALGWMTLGIAMLVVGGAVIWANATDATPRLVSVPALALLVISAGLLVGTFLGRARWLVLPALLVVAVVLFASVVRLPLEGRFGEVNLTPRTVTEIEGPYRVTAGRISIDLTRFEGQDIDLAIVASTVLGDIWITVPYDAHVVADGYTGYGGVRLAEDLYDSGLEVSFSGRSEPRWGDGMTVNLHLEAGLGSINVYREYPTRREIRRLKEDLREARRAAATASEGATQ